MSVSTINPAPANNEDILLNDDVWASFLATASTLGITDGPTIAAINAAKIANLAVGASATSAFVAANNLDAPPVQTHNGQDYGVDTTATPPILVVVVPIPASSIPIPATPPSPAPPV